MLTATMAWSIVTQQVGLRQLLMDFVILEIFASEMGDFSIKQLSN